MSNLEVAVLGSLALLVIAGPMIHTVSQYKINSNSKPRRPSERNKKYDFNPATGLPMMGPLDLDGNLWGTFDTSDTDIRN